MILISNPYGLNTVKKKKNKLTIDNTMVLRAAKEKTLGKEKKRLTEEAWIENHMRRRRDSWRKRRDEQMKWVHNRGEMGYFNF